ncbi:protein ROOT PRIMORDIUM DEFECTIVE [Salix suchowensis]|nr:protein ROOT PRIMORDIUM DEFECTIVE [Salix suchowensis]
MRENENLHNQISFQTPVCLLITIRSKTTSAQYVASRARDATFEKLMDKYKNFVKVIAIQDLILSNPNKTPPCISLDFLSKLSQKLHLNRGAPSFLRKYPHIFHIFYDPTKSQAFCRLTGTALEISRKEEEAVNASLPLVVDRLVRLLLMSTSKSLPLRAVFKVWRELGLPDDFEDSVIVKNPNIFRLCDGNEPSTHVLKLVGEFPDNHFTAAVENWRVRSVAGRTVVLIEWAFKLALFRPYEDLTEKKKTKAGLKRLEKRAVAIVHEFLSLTVEKMVEVEKISHFRNCFGIDMNMRDLFLDHPGMFYLSIKGKRHTVFLREAYERGRLIDPNPVYDVRRKLLDLVFLGRHDMLDSGSENENVG